MKYKKKYLAQVGLRITDREWYKVDKLTRHENYRATINAQERYWKGRVLQWQIVSFIYWLGCIGSIAYFAWKQI